MAIQYNLIIFVFMGLYINVSQATTCTEYGRFPDDENHDCRGHIMCLIGGITNFTEYKLICPQGSIYSHMEKQCTNATNYKCYPQFNCTITGKFIYAESQNCSSYITCIQGIKGLDTARLVECPQNTIFNSTVGDCVDKSQSMCGVLNPNIMHTIINSSIVHHSNNAVYNTISFITIFFICFGIILM